MKFLLSLIIGVQVMSVNIFLILWAIHKVNHKILPVIVLPGLMAAMFAACLVIYFVIRPLLKWWKK
jgi:hypothetical protein